LKLDKTDWSALSVILGMHVIHLHPSRSNRGFIGVIQSSDSCCSIVPRLYKILVVPLPNFLMLSLIVCRRIRVHLQSGSPPSTSLGTTAFLRRIRVRPAPTSAVTRGPALSQCTRCGRTGPPTASDDPRCHHFLRLYLGLDRLAHIWYLY
jgi:hypothetical protein